MCSPIRPGAVEQVGEGVIRYEIDHESGIVTVRYESPVTFQAWREMTDRILTDPEYHVGSDFLGDRRGVPDVPTTEYAKSRRAFPRNSPPAVRRRGRTVSIRAAMRCTAWPGWIPANMKHVIDARVFEDEQEAWASAAAAAGSWHVGYGGGAIRARRRSQTRSRGGWGVGTGPTDTLRPLRWPERCKTRACVRRSRRAGARILALTAELVNASGRFRHRPCSAGR